MKVLLILSTLGAIWLVSGLYHTEKDAMRLGEAFLSGVEAGKAEICDKMVYNVSAMYCQP